MLISSNPTNNPHFEQPKQITICQISTPKNNTSIPVETFSSLGTRPPDPDPAW